MQLPPLQQAMLNARFQPRHTSLWAKVKYVFVICGVLSLVISNSWIESNALCHHFDPCPIFFSKFAYAGPLSTVIGLDQPQLELPATSTPTGPRIPISTQPRVVMPWLSSNGGLLLSYLWLLLYLLFAMGLIDPDLNHQLISWLNPAWLLWTFLAIIKPGLNPDLWTEFPAWPQTSFVTVILPHELGFWLVPAIVSRFVLLASSGPCLGRWVLLGLDSHCLLDHPFFTG